MGVYNSWSPPPTPEPNPYPLFAVIPAGGAPGAPFELFKVTPVIPAAAALVPFRYAVEIEIMVATPGEAVERRNTSFSVATDTAEIVSRTAGYHTHRERVSGVWDGTGLVVSVIRDSAESLTLAGFLTSKRLTHDSLFTMLF